MMADSMETVCVIVSALSAVDIVSLKVFILITAQVESSQHCHMDPKTGHQHALGHTLLSKHFLVLYYF